MSGEAGRERAAYYEHLLATSDRDELVSEVRRLTEHVEWLEGKFERVATRRDQLALALKDAERERELWRQEACSLSRMFNEPLSEEALGAQRARPRH